MKIKIAIGLHAEIQESIEAINEILPLPFSATEKVYIIKNILESKGNYMVIVDSELRNVYMPLATHLCSVNIVEGIENVELLGTFKDEKLDIKMAFNPLNSRNNRRKSQRDKVRFESSHRRRKTINSELQKLRIVNKCITALEYELSIKK